MSKCQFSEMMGFKCSVLPSPVGGAHTLGIACDKGFAGERGNESGQDFADQIQLSY